MENVPGLLKSKRFWSAVIGLVVLVISSLNEQLSSHLSVIAPAVLGIIGILIGGYTAEDVATANQKPSPTATIGYYATGSAPVTSVTTTKTTE